MRISTNEIRHNVVWNGYDYNLQVWVKDGIIQKCGHQQTVGCCNAGVYAGRKIETMPKHIEVTTYGLNG